MGFMRLAINAKAEGRSWQQGTADKRERRSFRPVSEKMRHSETFALCQNDWVLFFLKRMKAVHLSVVSENTKSGVCPAKRLAGMG
jgi:hypothetical protein